MGDGAWTMMDAGMSKRNASLPYLEGKFYAVDFGVGKVVSIDVQTSPAKITTLPSLLAGQRYGLYHLVVSAGKLLLVARYSGKAVVGFKDFLHAIEFF